MKLCNASQDLSVTFTKWLSRALQLTVPAPTKTILVLSSQHPSHLFIKVAIVWFQGRALDLHHPLHMGHARRNHRSSIISISQTLVYKFRMIFSSMSAYRPRLLLGAIATKTVAFAFPLPRRHQHSKLLRLIYDPLAQTHCRSVLLVSRRMASIAPTGK